MEKIMQKVREQLDLKTSLRMHKGDLGWQNDVEDSGAQLAMRIQL